MVYFDTSFLVPLLIPEDSSKQVEAFFQHLPSAQVLVVSHWTRVEFVSVLSRLLRMKHIKSSNAKECAARFNKLLDDSFNIVIPGRMDFERCWDFITRFDNDLRAGDALHLAIAANLNAEKLYTLDNGLLKAGKFLKFPIDKGISSAAC
jgi:predicted nucleic acid-binding protein